MWVEQQPKCSANSCMQCIEKTSHKEVVLHHLILGTALILMMHCASQMDYLISFQSRISTKKPQLITMTMKKITVVKEW